MTQTSLNTLENFIGAVSGGISGSWSLIDQNLNKENDAIQKRNLGYAEQLPEMNGQPGSDEIINQ